MSTNQFNEARRAANEGRTWVCPRCDHPSGEFPAISRKDNRTPVCSRCGVEEAVRMAAGLTPWPDAPWPFIGVV